MTTATVFDHVRPADSDYPDGTYRVVGSDGEAVTLLRVADADGRRVHTGDVVTVGVDEFDGFVPAANPDGNRSLRGRTGAKLETVYWSLRAFAEQLRAHPLPAAAAGGLLTVGLLGDPYLSLPDLAVGGLILAGSLGLAYVGSGRP